MSEPGGLYGNHSSRRSTTAQTFKPLYELGISFRCSNSCCGTRAHLLGIEIDIGPAADLGSPLFNMRITGASLQRHLGPGVFHIVSGGIALTLGLFLIGLLPWQPGIFSAAPVALMIAIFSICNGLLRGLDLIISRPQDAISEGINTVCSLGVGVFLLENWRTASPSTIAFVTGILVLACGIAIAGSSWVQSKIEE
jgi:hypothetical protein